MNDRLYRSRDDRMLAGVAGGLAEYWDADPSLVRLVWALLVIFTGGLALLVYIVMAIVVPEDPGLPARLVNSAVDALTAPDPDWPAQRAAARTAAREARRAARQARRSPNGPRTGTLIVGAALVLLGAWFLLEEYVPAFDAAWFWPMALVGFGVVLLLVALRPRDEAPVLPGPAGPNRPADTTGATGGGIADGSVPTAGRP